MSEGHLTRELLMETIESIKNKPRQAPCFFAPKTWFDHGRKLMGRPDATVDEVAEFASNCAWLVALNGWTFKDNPEELVREALAFMEKP